MRSRSIEGVLTAILVLGVCEVAAAAGWTTSTRVRSVDAAINTLDAPEIAMSGQVVVWRSGLRATGPKVGIEATGRAAVAWTRGGVVQTNTQLASGLFGGAQGVTGAGAGGRGVELAVDGSGRAVALWVTVATILASTRSAADAAFGTPVHILLEFGVGNHEADMATSTRGDAVAAVDHVSSAGAIRDDARARRTV